jgi:flagellar basal body-associated protein FliL
MDDNYVTIFIMNIVVIVLFAVTLAFVIYTYNSNVQNIKKQREDINKIILYIRYFDNLLVELLSVIQQNSDDIHLVKEKALKLKNLMDLDEFKDISPELKAKYKKYVVDQIMTTFNAVINKNASTSPGKEFVSDENLQGVVIKLIASINSS